MYKTSSSSVASSSSSEYSSTSTTFAASDGLVFLPNCFFFDENDFEKLFFFSAQIVAICALPQIYIAFRVFVSAFFGSMIRPPTKLIFLLRLGFLRFHSSSAFELLLRK